MENKLSLRMIEISPNYWRIVYPEVVLKNEARFLEAKKLHTTDPVKAEKGYRQVIAACGDLFIDALSHLGILLNHRQKGTGTPYIVQAFTQARLVFPAAFQEGRDLLIYESRGNEFILSAYYIMAMELKDFNQNQQALDLFEFLLKINPKDNHGAGRWLEELKLKIKTEEGQAKKQTTEKKAIYHPIQMLATIENIASMSLKESKVLHNMFKDVEDKPWALDDGLVGRAIKQHKDSQEIIPYYQEQIKRWEALRLTPEQTNQIKAFKQLVETSKKHYQTALALAEKISANTIDKIIARPDIELAMDLLTGKLKY